MEDEKEIIDHQEAFDLLHESYAKGLCKWRYLALRDYILQNMDRDNDLSELEEKDDVS